MISKVISKTNIPFCFVLRTDVLDTAQPRTAGKNEAFLSFSGGPGSSLEGGLLSLIVSSSSQIVEGTESSMLPGL